LRRRGREPSGTRGRLGVGLGDHLGKMRCRLGDGLVAAVQGGLAVHERDRRGLVVVSKQRHPKTAGLGTIVGRRL